MASPRPTPPPTPGLLSVVLIVRDEESDIPACLESVACLAGLGGEVVVYDTGSTDRTRDLARSAGARVVEGYWDDDFGRARTAAAAAASGRWVLVLDADERVRADLAAFQERLESDCGPDGFTVRIDNAGGSDGSAGYASWGARVLRREGIRWDGKVHERPVSTSGRELSLATMPSHVLSLGHLGYAGFEQVRRKAQRNAALARAELDGLVRTGPLDQPMITRMLVDLGRSLIGAGRPQDAVDAFETIRELAPPQSQPWLEATDHLARLLLGAGHDDVVVVLSDQLRAGGADRRYCDWLRGQALAQLGRPREALELIRGVDELVDPAGRRYDLAQVRAVRSLLEELLALS
jgi:tetratricopeptide (TPR) repeat protein